MLRVLVVDDSHVARGLLTAILNGEEDIDVVGEASNGQEAIEKVALLKPDVVTMDVQMPRMDGFAATREIMITNPVPIVVVSGSNGQDDVSKTLHSLDAGALTVITKPPSLGSDKFDEAASEFLSTIRSMAAVRVIRHHRPRTEADSATVKTTQPKLQMQTAPRLVAIAASTGGPQTLRTVLSLLPSPFPLPIVVVQHISSGFTDGLVNWLSGSIALPLTVAAQGEYLQPNHVYFAPDELHCSVTRNGAVLLSDRPPLQGFRPSANVLFESAATAFESSLISVILTGMGNDGVEGLKVVRSNRGIILAQDESSSVVYGMPKAAADAGLPDSVLSPEQIAAELCRLSRC